MILTTLLTAFLAFLGGVFVWLGSLPFIASGLAYLLIAVAYYNTFLDVVPFLRLPFNLFISGVLLELMLIVLKLLLGSRSPMNSNSINN